MMIAASPLATCSYRIDQLSKQVSIGDGDRSRFADLSGSLFQAHESNRTFQGKIAFLGIDDLYAPHIVLGAAQQSQNAIELRHVEIQKVAEYEQDVAMSHQITHQLDLRFPIGCIRGPIRCCWKAA